VEGEERRGRRGRRKEGERGRRVDGRKEGRERKGKLY